MSRKVEIDGKEIEVYTDEELQEQLKVAKENARKDEKDKLYKTIANLESKIKESEEITKKLDDEKKAQEEAAKKKAKEEAEAKMTEMESLKNLFKEETSKIFTELEDLKKKNNSLESSLKDKETENLRIKLIAEAGTDLIVEMVSGNTEEEIKQSIEKSKKTYADMAEKLGANKKSDTSTNPQTPEKNENPPAPVIQAGEKKIPLTAEAVASMSATEYAKYREEILKLTNK